MDDGCNQGKDDYGDLKDRAFRRTSCPLFDAQTNSVSNGPSYMYSSQNQKFYFILYIYIYICIYINALTLKQFTCEH